MREGRAEAARPPRWSATAVVTVVDSTAPRHAADGTVVKYGVGSTRCMFGYTVSAGAFRGHRRPGRRLLHPAGWRGLGRRRATADTQRGLRADPQLRRDAGRPGLHLLAHTPLIDRRPAPSPPARGPDPVARRSPAAASADWPDHSLGFAKSGVPRMRTTSAAWIRGSSYRLAECTHEGLVDRFVPVGLRWPVAAGWALLDSLATVVTLPRGSSPFRPLRAGPCRTIHVAERVPGKQAP